MKKRSLIMAICAIITMGLAIPLGAQTSNQNRATAGVFKTDVDNYMSVKSWEKVKFDKWFGFLGGSNDGTVNLGYATNLGGIYLGGYYSGNIFRSSTNETKTLTTTWDNDLQEMLTKEDKTVNNQTSDYTDNAVSALIGVAGMGIKVGFSEYMTTYNTPYNVSRNGTSTVTQNKDGSIKYTDNDSISYEESSGRMTPSLQWGMKLNLGSGSYLTPRVNASANFYRNILIDEYYATTRTEYNGIFAGEENISRTENNSGYTTLQIGVGADYYLNDTFYIGLDYNIGLDFTGNDYSGAIKSGSIDGEVKTTAISQTNEYLDGTVKSNEQNLSAVERSRTSHYISPALYKTSTIGGDLKLGVLFSVPMSIITSTESNYTDKWTITETTYNDANRSSENTTTYTEAHTAGTLKETDYFSIAPTIGIGASYNLIPGRFTVNAGVVLNPISYSRTTTVTSRNGVDSTYTKTETGSGDTLYTSSESTTVTPPASVIDSVQYQSSWTGFNGSVRAGFVFSFYDNFSLDLQATTAQSLSTLPTTSPENKRFNINLTDVNVLFTFKF